MHNLFIPAIYNWANFASTFGTHTHCTLLQTDTTPATHRSVFYRPDALPAAQPTASKHWRQSQKVSGSGISWAMCKSAPRSRQITMPAPHHSVFYRPDALPAAQPSASKHWRQVPLEGDHKPDCFRRSTKSNLNSHFYEVPIIHSRLTASCKSTD